jgi:hypothetical protein
MISLKYFMPISIVLFILVIAFAGALREVMKVSMYMPNVILGKKSPKGVGGYVMCLLEPSDIFSHDSLVSFLIKEDNFEQFIGIGKVLNIQDDGKIQVVMTNKIGEFDNVIKKIKENNNEILKKLKVKPNIPSMVVNGR